MKTASVWLQLFRALIPSWRFFNDTMTVAVLEGRKLPVDGQTESWIPLLPKRGQRAFYELFYNPRDTILFASHAALEQFVTDPKSLTSQKLIESLARDYLTTPQFEFRVLLDGEEIYRSRSSEQLH